MVHDARPYLLIGNEGKFKVDEKRLAIIDKVVNSGSFNIALANGTAGRGYIIPFYSGREQQPINFRAKDGVITSLDDLKVLVPPYITAPLQGIDSRYILPEKAGDLYSKTPSINYDGYQPPKDNYFVSSRCGHC